MRLLKTALLTLVLAIGVARVNAIPFSDLDYVDQRLAAGGSASTYSGTFNILDDGFVPGTHQVWAAVIYFKLSDDGDSEGETYSINLDNSFTSTHYTGFLLLSGIGVGINLLASLNA